ncbi:ThiF family adenylyltransferase [Leeuwenhoekiella sp. A16]|uniref:ThiF family adenylyltransferase n=1 Tax=unclassified Leeuwenhoekiella TaxID=2615029 RepID=UPI003A7F88B7
MNKYSRQIKLPQVGNAGQQKIEQAKVLVIGAGGLGCAVLPYLTSAGIGTIGIIDGDTVDETNLHRQVLYAENTVGKSKAREAVSKLEALNSNVKFEVYDEFLSAENALQIIANYDIIVDATDTIAIRYLINDACVILDKPFVYGSVFRFEGQISVFNYKNGPTYRCLFKNEKGIVQNCAEVGVLGTTVGFTGMLQANEVMKMILEIGEILSGKLLVYNALTNDQSIFQYKKDENLVINTDFFEAEYLQNQVSEINPEEALALNSLLLDVREFDETPQLDLENSIQIPLSVLESEMHQLDKNNEILIYCQSGKRSLVAAKLLQKNQFSKIRSIKGGALAMNQIIENEKSIY